MRIQVTITNLQLQNFEFSFFLMSEKFFLTILKLEMLLWIFISHQFNQILHLLDWRMSFGDE